MKRSLHSLLLMAPLVLLVSPSIGQQPPKAPEGSEENAFVYQRVEGKDLKLYVFQPSTGEGKKRGAVVVFHGGGWSMGSAQWTFGQAQYFASLGMVGISVDYRLSDGKNVTPADAVEDARSAIRWVRGHAGLLNIDPKKIAAYGESAGGHLAAATAITGIGPKDELSGVPNALVLFSPAIDVAKGERFQKLLKPGQDVTNILPAEHIRRDMPPTIIVTGEKDTAPSPITLIEFCDKMKEAHNRCELHIFPGVGHMLRQPGENPDGSGKASKTQYDAYLKIDLFLKSMGYLPPEPKKN
jgi:acetyl esterase